MLYVEGSEVNTEGRDRGDQVPCFVCPITQLKANGRQRFRVMRGCGCVLSEKALKEVPSKVCLACGKPLETVEIAENSILIAPPEGEVAAIREVMLLRKAKRDAEVREVRNFQPLIES